MKLRVLFGRVKGAITVYITIVSLVYSVLLAPDHNPEGWLAFTNVLHHYIIPTMFIADFLLSNTQKYSIRTAFEWLIIPLLYLAYAMLLGIDSGQYVYFFLEIGNPDIGVNGFIMWVSVMLSLFTVVGLLYILYNRKIINGTIKEDAKGK